MKSIRVAVLIAAGAFAASSMAQNAEPGGSVDGAVVNSITGAGIGGASVVLTGIQAANRSGRYETMSDAAGHFKFTRVGRGSYRANVEKDGFSSRTPDLDLLAVPALFVGSGGDTVKVEIKLTPLTTVGGRIFGPDGKPAAGIEVFVTPNITADVASTDAEGRFALENILPGSYLLIARLPGNAKPQEAADGTRTAMITTYYPSVANQSLAQTIVVRGQENSAGYEIRMQTAPVYRVRGIARDEEGKPTPRAELTLYPIPEGTPAPMAGLSIRGRPSVFTLGTRRGPSGTPEATAISGEDGRFEFPAVRSGDWRINAVTDPLRDPQTGPRATTGVLVGRGDVDDLDIRVATPFKLTGTIEWKDGDRGQDPGRQLGLVTLLNSEGNEFAAAGIVEAGVLSFDNVLPGRYKLIVKPGLTAQTFLGENEVTGTFPVTPGGPRLRVVLKGWAGAVRGTVEKGEGATVVLVPRVVEGVATGQTVVCGAGGLFELNEVSPGDYYIAAFDRVSFLSPSAAILSLVPSRGTSVKVEERSTANVLLRVIAAPR